MIFRDRMAKEGGSQGISQIVNNQWAIVIKGPWPGNLAAKGRVPK